MAVPMGSSAGGDHFWRFQTSGVLRFAWQAWHFVTFSNVFCNVSKVVLRGRRNTFATFSEDVLHFSWQAQPLWTCPSSIFRGRRSTLDVSCCGVYCKSHWQGCVEWRPRCKFRGRRGIWCDVLKIDGSLARNIDFEVANFQVLRKTRIGKRRF